MLLNTPYGPTPALHSSHFLTKSSEGLGGMFTRELRQAPVYYGSMERALPGIEPGILGYRPNVYPTPKSKNGPQHDKCQVQTVGERMESNHLHQRDLAPSAARAQSGIFPSDPQVCASSGVPELGIGGVA